VAALCFLLGLAPLLIANIGSGGATFREIFGAANSPSVPFSPPLPPGLAGGAQALSLQLAATLQVGLPHTLGNTVVCGGCITWPSATEGTPTTALIWSGVVSGAFSLCVLLCWARAAAPLASDCLGDARRLLVARRATLPRSRAHWGGGDTYQASWWGRAMLVVGALGTMAQYVVSRAAYLAPVTSARYLVGLYLCAPLVPTLLVAGLRAGGRWLTIVGAHSSTQKTPRPPLSAVAAAALLVIRLALSVGGWRLALAESNDHAAFGQPAGQRQAALVTYLRERHISRFHTDYWTCYELVFVTDQQLSCAVFNDGDVFGRGTTRLDAMSALVEATPHAPYVFDLSSAQQRDRADEFAAAIVHGDPRAAGYTHTRVGEYEVYSHGGRG
jgi:hypothetical protein